MKKHIARLTPHCTDDQPTETDPAKQIHEFATTYEGAMWKTLTCVNCGYEVKAAPS